MGHGQGRYKVKYFSEGGGINIDACATKSRLVLLMAEAQGNAAESGAGNSIAVGMNEMSPLPVVVTGYLRLSGRHDARMSERRDVVFRAVCQLPPRQRRHRRKSASESICNHPRRDTRPPQPVAICTAGVRLIALFRRIPYSVRLPVPSFFAVRPAAC